MSAHVSGSKRSRGIKPISIRRGPVEVLIYTGFTTAAGKRYRRYSLVYREANGERRVQNFSDLQKAKTKTEEIATRLANGETELFNLKNADVAELTCARAILAPLGFTVAQAANDLAAAVQRLPAGTTLFEAVDWFAKRHISTAPQKSLFNFARRMKYVPTDLALEIADTPAQIIFSNYRALATEAEAKAQRTKTSKYFF